ncbi:MAG: B12-binding domain-containing radical SAM protein, partial [Candidatus Brocadiales bacterium]
MTRLVKPHHPQMPIFVGGPHPSSAQADVLNQLVEVDFAFQGEGELGVPVLVRHTSNGSKTATNGLGEIPGLIYRSQEGVKCNPPVFYKDLDSFGYPPWGQVLDLSPYRQFMPTFQARTKNSAPIVVTRGCPYNCTFCVGYKISGKGMRSRSLESTIEEVELLYRKFGIREIIIIDDNFTFDPSFVTKFCETLLKKQLDIKWVMPNGIRLNTLTRDLLIKMKESGCHSIVIGVESGSQRILKHMRKSLTLETIKEKVSLARSVGFPVHGFFILGYPEETLEDILKTEEVALRVPFTGATFSLFCPLPGSDIRKILEKRGEVRADETEPLQDSFSIPTYAPRGMTFSKLKRLQRKIMLRFYMRPRIIYHYLRSLFPLSRTWYVVRAGLRYFFYG